MSHFASNGDRGRRTRTASAANQQQPRFRVNGNSQPDKYVVITGGAGFIGSNLADRLLSLGERVLVYDNLSRRGSEVNLDWLAKRHGALLRYERKDVRRFDGLRIAVRGASAVFHFAAQVAVTDSIADPRSDFEVNAGGTLNVLEAARELSTPPRILFTSTNKVYGAMRDVPLVRTDEGYRPNAEQKQSSGMDETRQLDFCSPYGCSKGAADQYMLDYARTYRLPATVFRMSCIYGPRQFGTEDQGWLAHFLIRAMDQQPITLYGDGWQVRDVLYVDDLLEAFLRARNSVSETQGRAFNIGGGPGNVLSLRQLLDQIHELQGRPCQFEFADWRQADQRYYVSDIGKFQRATGWQPQVSVRNGVKKLYQWLLERKDGAREDHQESVIEFPGVSGKHLVPVSSITTS